MYHEGQDTHLGGTAIVELDSLLLHEDVLAPAGSLELGLLNLILTRVEAKLNQADESHDLGNASKRDYIEGLESRGTVYIFAIKAECKRICK